MDRWTQALLCSLPRGFLRVRKPGSPSAARTWKACAPGMDFHLPSASQTPGRESCPQGASLGAGVQGGGVSRPATKQHSVTVLPLRRQADRGRAHAQPSSGEWGTEPAAGGTRQTDGPLPGAAAGRRHLRRHHPGLCPWEAGRTRGAASGSQAGASPPGAGPPPRAAPPGRPPGLVCCARIALSFLISSWYSRSRASLGSSLMRGLFLMFLARLA